MRRRSLLVVAAAATAAPLAARTQQQSMPVVAFVRSTWASNAPAFLSAFKEGMRDAGYIEGRNVSVEIHSADGERDRLRDIVARLVRRPVAVIVGNYDAALAAKTATTTIPIVFSTGTDPVREGLVPSLNRPGANVTGVHYFGSSLGPKRLDLLRQVAPKASTIAMLVNPDNANTEAERTDVQNASEAIGQRLVVLDSRNEPEIEKSLATFARTGAGALLVGSGAFLNSKLELIVALTKRHDLPAIHWSREFADLGGLMSYGASTVKAYRQAGVYVGRILKGEKPADLPVVRSTTIELVINLRTAKAFGLAMPPTLLASADHVIE